MSRERFRVTVEQWAEIHQLPDSWPAARLREVLERADFDDAVDDADLLDMAVLALQDLDVQDAGELVLEVVFGQKMSAGVRQNLVDDLDDDRPWEQFASIGLQAGIFEAMVLLQQVFPNRYGIPDALRLEISLQALDRTAAGYLAAGSGIHPLVLRLLASGMPDNAVLNRLYSSELKSDEFAEAADILWQVEQVSSDAESATMRCVVYSSWQWLAPLEDLEEWEAEGWPDGAHSGR